MHSTAKLMPAHIPVLFSADEIRLTNENIAREIARTYVQQEFTLIALLKGSFVFAADLIRALHHQGCRPQIDFLTLSSYGDATQSSGVVTMMRELQDKIADKHIVLLDDILETGRTLDYARKLLLDQGAASVRIAVLLDKPSRHLPEPAIAADFVGFSIPDEFVVGYGLDYAGYYRELPFIGVLAE
jgi:hypoxanthine phosphoribosyltransferase